LPSTYVLKMGGASPTGQSEASYENANF